MRGGVLSVGASQRVRSAVQEAAESIGMGPVIHLAASFDEWPEQMHNANVSCVVVGSERVDPIRAAQRASKALDQARVVLFVGRSATASLLQDIMLTPGIRLVGVIKDHPGNSLVDELMTALDKAHRMWEYARAVEQAQEDMQADAGDGAASQGS